MRSKKGNLAEHLGKDTENIKEQLEQYTAIRLPTDHLTTIANINIMAARGMALPEPLRNPSTLGSTNLL